eukprot:2478419-Rhodomonas_salina.1
MLTPAQEPRIRAAALRVGRPQAGRNALSGPRLVLVLAPLLKLRLAIDGADGRRVTSRQPIIAYHLLLRLLTSDPGGWKGGERGGGGRYKVVEACRTALEADRVTGDKGRAGGGSDRGEANAEEGMMKVDVWSQGTRHIRMSRGLGKGYDTTGGGGSVERQTESNTY